MDFNTLPVMQMMTKKMAWLSKRTDVLAENVANADMPGYGARDLKKVSFRAMVRANENMAAAAPRLTSAHHLAGTKPVRAFRDEEKPDDFEATLDGNNVSIEQQLVKINESQISYQMTLNLYKKHLDLIQTAIGRRR